MITRHILHIDYDLHNNPLRIQFANGNVTKYVYSAAGEKLRAIHYTAVANTHVEMGQVYADIEKRYLAVDSADYRLGGNAVFNNGSFSKVLFDGGYVELVAVDMPGSGYNMPIVKPWKPPFGGRWPDDLGGGKKGPTVYSLQFRYFNRGHLGNVREMVSEPGEVKQVNAYYPFGTPIHALGTNESQQLYKYNGKEFGEFHGFNTYDYGARQYDAALGRWTSVDPMAGKHPESTPYAYCDNNPISFLDPNGMEKARNIAKIWKRNKCKFRTRFMNKQRFMRVALAMTMVFAYGMIAHAQRFNAVEKMRNAYRADDRMMGRQLLVGDVACLINDSLCDLSRTQVANDRYTCRYEKGPNNDVISRLEHGTRYFFEHKGDSLLIMGFENHLAKIDYDLPELWLKFPMHAGDSLSGLYHGCGLYGERWNVRKLGDYKTWAKLCRTMVLPEGDTLRNVLRLHTQRQVCTLNSPARMPGDSLPHFTPDSIRWHLANNKGVLVENVYRWYVAGWRYPILEVYVTGGSQSQAPLFTTAFYYSPREQECLSDDNPNTLIRKAVTQQETNGHALADNDKELDYKVSVDSERKTIRLTYNLERETHVRLILSDNAGIVYKTSERKDVPGKTHVQEIGYGMLPRGRYVLYINANGKRYAEKFKH